MSVTGFTNISIFIWKKKLFFLLHIWAMLHFLVYDQVSWALQ